MDTVLLKPGNEEMEIGLKLRPFISNWPTAQEKFVSGPYRLHFYENALQTPPPDDAYPPRRCVSRLFY